MNLFIEQFDNIFSLVPAHQGLLFFVIFSSMFVSTKLANYKYMAYYKLSVFLFFLLSYFYYYEQIEIIVWIFYITLPITFLILPTFYLYIDSITQITSTKRKKILPHFAPTIIISILLLPYLFLSPQEKMDFINYGFKSQNISNVWLYIFWVFRVGVYFGLIGQMIFYPILFYRLIKQHHKNILFFFSYTETVKLKWLNTFIALFLSFFLLSFFTLFVGINANIWIRIAINMIFALVNLYFGIKAIIQPNVYSLLRNKEKIANDLQIVDSRESIEYEDIRVKYSGSSLSDEFKQELIKKLEEYLLEKPYKNIKITIEDFAEVLGTNTRYLSQIINENYNLNFFTFINNYRVKEAMEILKSENRELYTIEAIANMVGFHSKSSFNNAFKKHTGQTPSDFRKQNKE